MEFSSPCGDKLQYQMLCLKTINKGFSPPYGDGTAKWVDMTDASWFSPPYGDSTACLMCFMAGCCFSPPYGDGILVAGTYNVKMGFSPPYGENPLSHGLRRASSPEGGAYRRVTAAVKALPSGELARSA